MNLRCFPSMKAIYFSMLLGMALISRSCFSPFLFVYACFLAISLICYIMKWLSYPRRLWNMTSTFVSSGFILTFRLHSWCAEPLNFPVIWQWSLTRTSLSVYLLPQMWQWFIASKLASSSLVMISGLLNLVLTTFLQCSTSFNISSRNLYTAFFPLYTLTGFEYLSS